MMTVIFEYIKPVQFLLIGTLAYALFSLRLRHRFHQEVIEILLVCLLTEVVSSVQLFFRQPIGAVMTIGTFAHNLLWLLLLAKNTSRTKKVTTLIWGFVVFGLLNFIFWEGQLHFNYYTFVVGALLYIVIFIVESFYRLRREDFPFFTSNTYLLLSAPILLFFGLSFMFGFKSREITSAILFGDVKLYTFIIYFVNIIFYTLLSTYIYRENQLTHDR